MTGKYIPILKNHDTNELPIGRFEDGFVVFEQPIEKEKIFRIFGDVGYRLNREDITEDNLIEKIEIMEWSITDLESAGIKECELHDLVGRPIMIVSKRQPSAKTFAKFFRGKQKDEDRLKEELFQDEMGIIFNGRNTKIYIKRDTHILEFVLDKIIKIK